METKIEKISHEEFEALKARNAALEAENEALKAKRQPVERKPTTYSVAIGVMGENPLTSFEDLFAVVKKAYDDGVIPEAKKSSTRNVHGQVSKFFQVFRDHGIISEKWLTEHEAK